MICSNCVLKSICLKEISWSDNWKSRVLDSREFEGWGIEKFGSLFRKEEIPNDCFFTCKSSRQIAFDSGSLLYFVGWTKFKGSWSECCEIRCRVKMIPISRFSNYRKMKFVHIWFDSSLNQTESSDFCDLLSKSVIIPSEMVILCSNCFSKCQSPESITFESPSSLRKIESNAFWFSSSHSMIIPCKVKIIHSECCMDIWQLVFQLLLVSAFRSFGRLDTILKIANDDWLWTEKTISETWPSTFSRRCLNYLKGESYGIPGSLNV
jgi:hypothetical protein